MENEVYYEGKWGQRMLWLVLGLILLGVLMMLGVTGLLYQRQQDAVWNANRIERRIERLEETLAHDHAAYGNRGIIQKRLLEEASKHGWFVDADTLKAISKAADYPSD